MISFDDLKKSGNTAALIQIHITNGSVFKGKLVSINDEMLRIDVEGSEIPFSRDVITQITLLPEKKIPVKQEKKNGSGST